MIVVRNLFTALVVSLLLASRPAAAQQSASGTVSPLIGPSPAASPPTSELALGGLQLFVGAAATLGASAVLVLAGAATGSAPVAAISGSFGPGFGGWAVCGIGRMSTLYDGDCTGAIVGSYLGSIALGVSGGIIGYYEFAPRISDGGYDQNAGAAAGAAIGILVGSAVGATIGWQLSKRRRDQASAKTLVPVPPRPRQAGSDAWSDRSDLGPRTQIRTQAATFSVPLLTLRF